MSPLAWFQTLCFPLREGVGTFGLGAGKVSPRCGILIVGLRSLLVSEVAIESVKEWHLFLDLMGMWVQNQAEIKNWSFFFSFFKNVFCKAQPAGGAIWGQWVKGGICWLSGTGNVHAKFQVNGKLHSWFEAFCSKQTNPANCKRQY